MKKEEILQQALDELNEDDPKRQWYIFRGKNDNYLIVNTTEARSFQCVDIDSAIRKIKKIYKCVEIEVCSYHDITTYKNEYITNEERKLIHRANELSKILMTPVKVCVSGKEENTNDERYEIYIENRNDMFFDTIEEAVSTIEMMIYLYKVYNI